MTLNKKGGVNPWDYIPKMGGSDFAPMFKAIANHYLSRFCKLNGYDFKLAQWKDDEPGGIAFITPTFSLTFEELRFMVENRLPASLAREWSAYNERILSAEEGIRSSEKFTTLKKISLKEWCQGHELPYTYKRLRALKGMAQRHLAKHERSLHNNDKGGV